MSSMADLVVGIKAILFIVCVAYIVYRINKAVDNYFDDHK